jgi:RNase_H superfamily
MGSKILVLDIETRPAKAYIWRCFDENIGHEQILDPGGIICFAAKWVGNPEVFFYSSWTHTHEQMVKAAHDLLSDADALITYNGDKFDLPKLNGEFLRAGLSPPIPYSSIDLLKHVRKLGFLLNRLAFIAPFLGVGSKLKHQGFSLWVKVMEGDTKAQHKMEKYNKQDVLITERLYLKIRPFIKNHPHLGLEARSCGACGSNKVHSRGWRRTKTFRIQSLQCQSCGSWQEGKREKV